MKIRFHLHQTVTYTSYSSIHFPHQDYENYWNGIRQIVVYEGLIAKFSQNDKLREGLLHTKDQILAECAEKTEFGGLDYL